MADHQPAHEEAEVLVTNEAFYRAFSRGDLRAMSKLWAHLATVTCLHPGMSLLSGRAAVMGSWAEMLSEPPSVELHCIDPRVRVIGKTALVTCYEAGGSDPARLAATNVFTVENGEWKLVHHHAGPMDAAVSPPKPMLELN